MWVPGLCEAALVQHVRVRTSANNLHSNREALRAGCWPVVLSSSLELVFSVPRGRLRPVGFKQEARLVVCGLLSPCKTLRNFLLPPTAECGNPCCQATSAVTHSCSLGSSFYTIAYFLDVLCI